MCFEHLNEIVFSSPKSKGKEKSRNISLLTSMLLFWDSMAVNKEHWNNNNNKKSTTATCLVMFCSPLHLISNVNCTAFSANENTLVKEIVKISGAPLGVILKPPLLTSHSEKTKMCTENKKALLASKCGPINLLLSTYGFMRRCKSRAQESYWDPRTAGSLTLDFQCLLNHGILLSIYLYSCFNEQINNYTAHWQTCRVIFARF